MKITGKSAGSIAESIERQLSSLPPSALLPPVRTVADRLHVSPATVAAAYRILRARGLAAGAGRRGTRLLARAPVPVLRLSESLPSDTVDLSSGLPDPLFLPGQFSAALLDIEPRDDGPVDRALLAFAATEFEADGIPSAHLLVSSGALDAIERILREQLRPGDRVALEDPSLPEIRELVVSSGFIPVGMVLDPEGPEPSAVDAALAAGCRAIIVTPRAQNPTGAAIGEKRAGELRRSLGAYPDVAVIENDYAAPVSGAAIHPLRTATGERWAIVRSTSKFLGPDLRLALVAGDALTIARVRNRQALGARWVSRIVQRLVLASWSDPAGGRRLSRATEIYAHRRAVTIAALAEHGLTATGRSGFNVWVPVREETAVVMGLRARGWAVAAGEPFRMRSQPAIRVTTSGLVPAEARRFAADVAAVVKPRQTAAPS